MDVDDRYSFEIQHQKRYRFPKKAGKANYAILTQLSIFFEIPDIIERVHESRENNSDKYRIQT